MQSVAAGRWKQHGGDPGNKIPSLLIVTDKGNNTKKEEVRSMKCSCGNKIEVVENFSFTHGKIKFTVQGCKKCAREEILKQFDKYRSFFRQQSDGTVLVDWDCFRKSSDARKENLNVIELLKAMRILTTDPPGWEVVEYQTISCGWEYMVLKAIINPSIATLGDPVLFTKQEEAIAFAESECESEWSWEVRQISAVYCPRRS